ncbi:hypothetical protein D3C76_1391880 [compost metagenome]
MSSDTPIIDMAKIVSRLAERLDCTTAALRETAKQRDVLAKAWDAQDDHINQQADRIESLENTNAGLGKELGAAQKRSAELTEFLRHIKKCLVRNGEYAPLSHEEIDILLGILADGIKGE